MLVSSRSTSLGYRYTVSVINAGGTNSIASAVFPQPRYAIIDLGTSGTPYAINNAGMVASAVSSKVASIWTNGVSVTCPTNFYANGSGGISTNGQIVGYVIQNASHYGDTNGVPAYTNTVDAPAVWSPESGVVPATTDDGAFLGTYNYASLIVPMPPAHAELFYNGTAISPSGMAAGTANVDYLDYGGYQYPLIVWDAYSAPFSYSPAAASAVGTTPSSFVPVAVNDSQEMVGNEDTGAHGYMTVADGTFVALELHPYDINNAHLAVGSDTDTGGGEVYNLATSETTPLGSYRAIKINNASPAQILDNGNQLWNYDSTNSLYRPVSIPDYLPDSPWSSPSFTALNDNGAIVGTASLTTTAGTSSHGIMLVPLSFVRETTSGSGTFQPIFHNGLDDQAQLPIFASETGQGLVETDTGGYTFNATLSTDLTGTSTATISGTYTISGGGSYTGTFTETGAGSGVFHDSGGINILTLTPTNQTTSSTSATTLIGTITIPSLSISGQTVTLIQASPLVYQASTQLMDVFLSGALSTTVVNTIVVSFYNSFATGNDAITLTETGVNTRIFKNSTNSVTLTMAGFTGGTSMVVSVSASGLTPSSFGDTLTETGSTTLQYSNFHRSYSTANNDTPATDGQCVFYVQFAGSTSTSITLVSGSSSVTTSATPVSGHPGLLRTGKLVLLEPSDTFSASGYTTLTANPPTGGGTPKVQLQMYGQTIVDPGTVHDAYLGYGLGDANGSWHLGQVQTILTQNLGWPVPTIHAVSIKSDVLTELPKHSLWYVFTHGLTADGVHPPLLSFRFYNSSDPADHKHTELFPNDVSANIGTGAYQLVFFNACFSADTTAGSAAPTFATNFNTQEYVGWAGDQREIVAYTAGKNFFLALQQHAKVLDAVTAENNNLSHVWLSRSNLTTLVDKGVSIDLSGSATNH